MRTQLAVVLLLAFALASPAHAQQTAVEPAQRGLRLSGFPALNYNSDEGFGYGARATLFDYGNGAVLPYRWAVDAQVFLTTHGRREGFVFVDVPSVGGGRRRLTTLAHYQYYGVAPYYGIGNDTRYREALETSGDPAFVHTHYYAFDRRRALVWAMLQHRMGPVRLLGGSGIVYTAVDTLGAATLLAADRPHGYGGGWTNFVKAGIVFDTRDREAAPTRGDWIDLLVSVSNRALGSDYEYARFTFTQRHYATLAPRLVLAERVLVETSAGRMPFFEMPFYESSFRSFEGVGGDKTVRGLFQNRLIGPTKLFGNLELRWRFTDFSRFGQTFFLAAGPFFDFGRVWRGGDRPSVSGFSTGQGAGLHLGWNENFIISADAATSREQAFALYVGVGYLY